MARRRKARSVKQPQRQSAAVEYPSLNEHRASRRRFLAGSAAVLGAGALAACSRPFGGGNDYPDGPGGVVEEPDYHRIRFPEEPGERSAYLMDGGYVTFYAVAMTYCEDCAFFAIDARPALTDDIAIRVADYTYDQLSTDEGVRALQGELRAMLDEAYNEDTGDVGTDWFEAVEVTIVRLDPPDIIGGIMGPPEYP